MLAQQMKRQTREDQILLRLDKMNFLTSKQLNELEPLAGIRNTQRILSEMEKDRLLLSMRMEQKVYYMSNRGKERIGSTQPDLKKNKIVHTLMRNDLYIKLGMPPDWKNEAPLNWGDNKIIPDAVYKLHGEFQFIEIDNKQTMKTNIEKIKKYKELSKVIFNQYKHHPALIWYTLSGLRHRKLKEICETLGVKYRIYGNM
ncbi:replication-relaxation family protein [Virgibacillus salexigens]|uniref:Replication-relaxation n=1 Tax=Virgibacillus kapii TaxID=1638645 RepID=A0ABQ2DLA8_9BACI|nr:replication-relaxation family protein [Virgibacillus kapii]GGJ62178.1 hypothetical protein GCM10007111_25370 [Virgibacillus kapii]